MLIQIIYLCISLCYAENVRTHTDRTMQQNRLSMPSANTNSMPVAYSGGNNMAADPLTAGLNLGTSAFDFLNTAVSVDGNIRMKKIEWDSRKYISDIENKTNLEITKNNNQTDAEIARINSDTDKHISDNALKSAESTANASIKTALINAASNVTGQAIQVYGTIRESDNNVKISTLNTKADINKTKVQAKKEQNMHLVSNISNVTNNIISNTADYFKTSYKVPVQLNQPSYYYAQPISSYNGTTAHQQVYIDDYY